MVDTMTIALNKPATEAKTPDLKKGVKLHLGCGPKYIKGYYHIDIADDDHIDHQGKVEQLDFIPDNSVELIYACHVLEHFGRYEVKDVLREWYRTLEHGGILRLAVPNFAAVVQMYSSEGLQDGMSGLVGLVCGGQRNFYQFHKMIFDEPLLTSFLTSVGFEQIRHWDWRVTEHSHIDDYSQAYLPHLDKQSGQLMSLNIEATKP